MFTLHSEEQALIELDFCSEKIRCVEKPLQEKKKHFDAIGLKPGLPVKHADAIFITPWPLGLAV